MEVGWRNSGIASASPGLSGTTFASAAEKALEGRDRRIDISSTTTVADGVDANSDLHASAESGACRLRLRSARHRQAVTVRSDTEDHRHANPAPGARGSLSPLADSDVLASPLPGCEGLQKISNNRYSMKMKMAMASISLARSTAKYVTDQNPPTSFRLLVEGAGQDRVRQRRRVAKVPAKDAEQDELRGRRGNDQGDRRGRPASDRHDREDDDKNLRQISDVISFTAPRDF